MNPNDSKKILPRMATVPIIDKLKLPSRAELLPQIESGELDHLDFRALVFGTGPIKNPFQFRPEDLPAFAASFEGQPFLRNHDLDDIGARDGTILASAMAGNGAFVQDIRLTTRAGMTDYIEGRMDRFSVGFDYTDCICTICNSSWMSTGCQHWPGAKYQTPTGEVRCELLFLNPTGLETSAVNSPAVANTGIESALSFKMSIFGADDAAAIGIAVTDESEPAAGQEPESGESQPEDLAQARRNSDGRRLALAERFTPQIGEIPMNLRELMSQRAEHISAAASLHNQAETENRDLSAEERAEFGRLMDEADALASQIETIRAERERLSAAQSSLSNVGDAAEKPAAPTTPKTLKRTEFDALPMAERSAFVRGGGKITE